MKKLIQRKTLLIFANYSKGTLLPSVKAYLSHLAPYFTEVVVASNLKLNLPPHNLKYNLKICENKGYDFGMWYNILREINLKQYDRIALVNDSNTLVGNFEDVFRWGDNNGLDMWGLTDSQERPQNYIGRGSYHIQSFFLVFERKAIKHLMNFYSSVDFDNRLMHVSSQLLREKIINECELGLTQHMVKKRMKVGARWSIFHKNKKWTRYPANMHVLLWEELLKDGYPLMKNKIIEGYYDENRGNIYKFRFNFDESVLLKNAKNRWKYLNK